MCVQKRIPLSAEPLISPVTWCISASQTKLLRDEDIEIAGSPKRSTRTGAFIGRPLRTSPRGEWAADGSEARKRRVRARMSMMAVPRPKDVFKRLQRQVSHSKNEEEVRLAWVRALEQSLAITFQAERGKRDLSYNN